MGESSHFESTVNPLHMNEFYSKSMFMSQIYL